MMVAKAQAADGREVAVGERVYVVGDAEHVGTVEQVAGQRAWVRWHRGYARWEPAVSLCHEGARPEPLALDVMEPMGRAATPAVWRRDIERMVEAVGSLDPRMSASYDWREACRADREGREAWVSLGTYSDQGTLSLAAEARSVGLDIALAGAWGGWLGQRSDRQRLLRHMLDRLCPLNEEARRALLRAQLAYSQHLQEA